MISRFIALKLGFLLSLNFFAYDTPLSDEAIREAYFLGQHHDESLLRFLDRYSRYFPIPKTGPHISSITLLTPYAAFAESSSHHIGAYSAQQALLDYRAHPEIVKVTVEIHLTNSYGQFLSPTEASSSSANLTLRPHDFWKDFEVQVSAGNRVLAPATFHGQPISYCGPGSQAPCSLTGANLELEFPARSFSSDSITVKVIPPEGAPVSANFQTSRLR
jgi:hypothetical protein